MDTMDRVLDFVRDLRIPDIPHHVRHQAKRCLLDTVGAVLAGTATPVARMMADYARLHYREGRCTVLVGDTPLSPVGACLANGYAANALDIDDGYRLVKGHPGACLLPVLLAAAEEAESPPDGRELLTAAIVGYEIALRAGLVRNADPDTYFTSGSWGAVGGAALAGRLFGLRRETLREALGAADYHAPAGLVMKGVATPCMAKDGVGWGAMVAMASTLMAREGFTAAEPLFDDPLAAPLVEELGEKYRILDLYFKPFCACRWAQPAVAGALQIVREHSLPLDAIESIRIETFRNAAALSRVHPTNTEQAQYNFSYPVAVALADGRVSPEQVLPPRIFDPKLLELMDSIRVEVNPQFEAAFPRKTISQVHIRTRDGRELTSGPVEPRWEPPDTLPSDAELEEKFQSIVGPLLGEEETGRLSGRIWNIEDARSVKEILPARGRIGTRAGS